MAIEVLEIGRYASFTSRVSSDGTWAYYQFNVTLDNELVRRNDGLVLLLHCGLSTNQLPLDDFIFPTPYGSISDPAGSTWELDQRRYGGSTGLGGNQRCVGHYSTHAASAFTGGTITIICRDSANSPAAADDIAFLVNVYRVRGLGSLIAGNSKADTVGGSATINTNSAGFQPGSKVGFGSLAWEHDPSGGETLNTSANGTAINLSNYVHTTSGRTMADDGLGGGTGDHRDLAAAMAVGYDSGAFSAQGYRGTLSSPQTTVLYVGALTWYGETVVVPGAVANLQTPFGHYLRSWVEEDELRIRRSDGPSPPFDIPAVVIDEGPVTHHDLYRDGGRIFALYEASGQILRRPSDDDGATWGATEVAFSSGAYPRAVVDPVTGTILEFALVGAAIKARRRNPGDLQYSAEFTPTGIGTVDDAPFGVAWAFDEQRRLILAVNNGTQIVEYVSFDDGTTFAAV